MPEHSKAAIRCSLLLMLVLTFAVNLARADDSQPSPNVIAGISAYNRGDFNTAYVLLKQEADRGDSDAEVNLGYLYARGHAVSINQVEAFRLFDLSARQGNSDGMNALGYKYEAGTGIKPDAHQAILWFCAAVRLGNARAMNNLAVMLYVGKQTPRNITAARDLWKQAMDRGEMNAIYGLGLSLINFPDRAEDRQIGTQRMIDAAKHGQINAQQFLLRSGYYSALPPAIDFSHQMILTPHNAPPGHADICGSLIS